jgi:hypothetical protein
MKKSLIIGILCLHQFCLLGLGFAGYVANQQQVQQQIQQNL